ncbi:MAG TPA: bifunctional [glutamate--ammonia ligase]-adenylyl-L-tyrosine phosphorylase/[glutamate--ammonia-ligase] adenylyltransferase [Gammaproteobacteria bacterium]
MEPIPPELQARARRIAAQIGSLASELPPAAAETAVRVCTVSDVILKALLDSPKLLSERVGDASAPGAEDVAARLGLPGLAEPEAMAALRRFRNVELARIAWRDLAGWADIDRSLLDLTALAEGLVAAAVGYAEDALAPRYGRAATEAGKPAPLLVLGMGKLGGRELNYSSDIDLVFLYPEEAELPGREQADVEEYFRRLAQLLIKLLDQVTEHGFVFRVDTRLRPFGASGPLVLSVSAFEAYLLQHGRDWERYAYVKARLLTGHAYQRAVFDAILTPFVYRRYLDFGVFEALRTMKRLISQEVARKDLRDNIKLGSGGIREIEFIAQVFQLVRGGRVAGLRTPSLLKALPLLAEHGQLTPAAVATLLAAYRHLRTVENRLQALEDQQTHDLPGDAERRARLALALGARDWATLVADLDRHRRAVEAEFGRVAWEGGADGRAAGVEGDELRTAWETGAIAGALEGTKLGADAEAVRLLAEFRGSALYRRMDEIGRQRLAAVITRTIPLLEQQATPALTIARVLPVFQAIARRSAYLSLLEENRDALERLLTVAGQSPLLARQISEHPLLLDELLDARLFDAPPTRAELERSLEQYLKNVSRDDLEALLDAMRQFQRAAIFRIAVADGFGGLPLMKVSDRLTDTAELVLGLARDIAYAELEAKHGKPMCGEPNELREAQFVIIGYGKLGGLELGYGSDLDLVFLHDSHGSHQETDGQKPLDNAHFFARLVQRLLHFLTIQTSSGRLYEVDTRLRPDGGKGLMVVSLDNFRRYQREEAWTWEHQALLRSRSVGGPAELRAIFENERREILIHHVDRAKLKDEVRKMRARMRKELSKGDPQTFDIKQDAGGLADIEFLIDYWVLASADKHPELVTYPDNVRQLEALEAARLVPAEHCRRLKDAYLELRKRTHELALAEAGRVVPAAEFRELRAWVVARWRETFGADAV